MKIRRFISSATVACMLLVASSTPVFAQVSNYEPENVIINGVEYLDGVPVYDNQETEDQLKVTREIMNIGRASVTYNKWYKDSTSYYYTNQKTDSYSNRTSQPYKKKLSSTSVATVKVTGSTSFGFEDIASAELSTEIGYKWEESYEETINVKPWTKYSVKTACNVKKIQYQYNEKGMTSKYTTYYAYTHDEAGGETWLWENAL